jgi:hypothetical protein
MISRKLSKKKSKRLSRKTKHSSRKRLSKKIIKRLSKRLSKKTSRKNKNKSKKRSKLIGGGQYTLKTPGGGCFSFTNLVAFSNLIDYIQKTFYSGTAPTDTSILQKQMNMHRQGIQDLKIALGELKTNNKFKGDMTVKAFEALLFIETNISDKINEKRKKANLPDIRKTDNTVLTDAPFKYDTMEDLWVNTIVRPSDSVCK